MPGTLEAVIGVSYYYYYYYVQETYCLTANQH